MDSPRRQKKTKSENDLRAQVIKHQAQSISFEHNQKYQALEERNQALKAEQEELLAQRKTFGKKLRRQKHTKELWEQAVEFQNQIDLLMAKEHLSGTPEENKYAIQSQRYLVFLTATQYSSETQCPFGFLKVTQSGEWKIVPFYTKKPKFYYKIAPKRRSFALQSQMNSRFLSANNSKGTVATASLVAGMREQIIIRDKIWHIYRERKKRFPLSVKNEEGRTLHFMSSGVPMRASLVTCEMLREHMGPLVVYFEGEEESDLTKKSRAFSTKIRGKKLQKNTSAQGIQDLSSARYMRRKRRNSLDSDSEDSDDEDQIEDKEDAETVNKTIQQIQSTGACGFLGFCPDPPATPSPKSPLLSPPPSPPPRREEKEDAETVSKTLQEIQQTGAIGFLGFLGGDEGPSSPSPSPSSPSSPFMPPLSPTLLNSTASPISYPSSPRRLATSPRNSSSSSSFPHLQNSSPPSHRPSSHVVASPQPPPTRLPPNLHNSSPTPRSTHSPSPRSPSTPSRPVPPPRTPSTPSTPSSPRILSSPRSPTLGFRRGGGEGAKRGSASPSVGSQRGVVGWTGGVKGGSGEDGKRKTTFSGPVSVADRIEPTPLSHSTVSTSTPLNDGGGWEGDSKEDEDKGGDKEEFDATMQMLKAQGAIGFLSLCDDPPPSPTPSFTSSPSFSDLEGREGGKGGKEKNRSASLLGGKGKKSKEGGEKKKKIKLKF